MARGKYTGVPTVLSPCHGFLTSVPLTFWVGDSLAGGCLSAATAPMVALWWVNDCSVLANKHTFTVSCSSGVPGLQDLMPDDLRWS